jgi:ornithine carbamoyltransferase
MHDMPIHRGYEITEEVIRDPKSLIYEQSENRLYSAKSILLKVLGKY